MKDVSRWDIGGCGEKGQIGNHPKQLKRGRVKAGLFAQTLVQFGLLLTYIIYIYIYIYYDGL